MTGPRVYAKLMDRATREPSQQLKLMIVSRVEVPLMNLAEEFAEMLRQAYVEGCRDGYAEAVREAVETAIRDYDERES